MRRRFLSMGWVGLALMVSATGAGAADLASCAGLQDPAARLACYDAAAGRSAVSGPAAPAPSASAPAAVTKPTEAAPVAGPAAAAAVTGSAASAPAAAAAVAGGEDTFGFSAERRLARESNEIDRIRARIVTVGNQARPGRWVFTLDNGQVWEQRDTPRPEANRPRPGDEVTIRRASLGSFLMQATGRGTFRVARVK